MSSTMSTKGAVTTLLAATCHRRTRQRADSFLVRRRLSDRRENMSAGRASIVCLLLIVFAVGAPGAVLAQQGTGAPGSPNATTTIDGKVVPNPPASFGGVINQRAENSIPYWPPRIVPPKGAPNVLLIMTDDAGYGVSGTFGGVIPTPALDRIANAGLRYTQFHSTALCSPSRAALLTGRNHHS